MPPRMAMKERNMLIAYNLIPIASGVGYAI